MGPYERRSGAMSVEQRGPAVCRFSGNQEGKDEMTKASVNLQDLRRRIYGLPEAFLDNWWQEFRHRSAPHFESAPRLDVDPQRA